MPAEWIAGEIEPQPSQVRQAAMALQNLGFKVLHIGTTISVQAPRSTWESNFAVSFEPASKPVAPDLSDATSKYWRASGAGIDIPEKLAELIVSVSIMEPPEFFGP